MVKDHVRFWVAVSQSVHNSKMMHKMQLTTNMRVESQSCTWTGNDQLQGSSYNKGYKPRLDSRPWVQAPNLGP